MSPREEFTKVLTALRAHTQDELRKALAPVERDYELKLWRLYRAAFPSRSFSLKKAEKWYGTNLPLLQAEFRLRGQPLIDAHRAERERLGAELKRLAPLVPLDPPADGSEVRFSAHFPSEYHTQGGGADTCARVWAELTVFTLESVGVVAGSRRAPAIPDNPARAADEYPWEVWVRLDPVQVEAAKRLEHKVPLPELVRFCWKHGANPRVFWPLLPAGFEEENGLDYFGGYSKDQSAHVGKGGGA